MSGRNQETTRLLNLTRRVRVNRIDDSGDVQTLQVESHGAPIPDVPHALPYGLAVGVPKKAVGLLHMIGGAWDNVVAWAFSVPAHRPRDLSEGDVTLYSKHAARVDLRSAGTTVKGAKLDVADGYCNAKTGFKTNGSAGVTGTAVFVDGFTGGTMTIILKGGIVTSVVATPPMQWTPA